MLKKLLFVVLLALSGSCMVVFAEQGDVQQDADKLSQAEQEQNVRYDKQKDMLNMNASEMPLKRVLSLIAMQSHIEVLFDEHADRAVTMSFEDAPLQKALENLLRGSSYAFRYTRDSNDKPLLIGVTVLPDGEIGDGNAQPLLHAAGETFMHMKNNHLLSADEMSRQQAYNERWQARVAEMPPLVREKAQQHAAERIKKLDEKRASREAKQKERKAESEARKAERQAKQQQQLEAMSPEELAIYEQRRENVKRLAQERAQQVETGQ